MIRTTFDLDHFISRLHDECTTRAKELIDGNVPSMERYKLIVGQIQGLNLALETVNAVLHDAQHEDSDVASAQRGKSR